MPVAFNFMVFVFSFTFVVFILGRHLGMRVARHDVEEAVNTAILLSCYFIGQFSVFSNQTFRIISEPEPWLRLSNFLAIYTLPVLGVVVAVTTLVKRLLGKPVFHMQGRPDLVTRVELRKKTAWFDLRRKVFHIILFVFMCIAFFQGYSWFRQVLQEFDDPPLYLTYAFQNYWGSMGLAPAFLDPEYLGVANIIIFLIFHVQFHVYLVMELCRFSPVVDFPLQHLLVHGLRRSETTGFASYLYFAGGFMMASMLVPPLGLLALFGLSCFGDTMAAQVGMKVGRHRLGFNREKSWEGLVAGTVISYFVAWLFLGWIWALVATAMFAIIDSLTPGVLKASDNILFPVATSLVFLGFSLLGIPYTPVLPATP